jgi:hypothetical protein
MTKRFFITGGWARVGRGSARVVPALLALLALSALSASLAQPAGAAVPLFETTVPVKSTAEADKTAALREALRAIAVRVSGRRGAAGNAVINAADPTRYVQQYGWSADRALKVGFDGRGIEQLLTQAGLPFWPAERPTTLVALFLPAVADGKRAVFAAERPAERAVAERTAAERGLPMAWPGGALTPAQAAAAVADEEGRARPVLVGVPAGAAFDWTFTCEGASSRGHGDVRVGIDLAADALAALYGPDSTRALGATSVRVGGIDSVGSYAELIKYLESLSMVRGVAVEEASGDSLRLRLTMHGDKALLRRIAALDGRLQPPTATAAATASGDTTLDAANDTAEPADPVILTPPPVTAGPANDFIWRP